MDGNMSFTWRPSKQMKWLTADTKCLVPSFATRAIKARYLDGTAPKQKPLPEQCLLWREDLQGKERNLLMEDRVTASCAKWVKQETLKD